MERKAASIARLKSEGIPVLPSLPTIESAAEARPPTAHQIAARALALIYVSGHAAGVDLRMFPTLPIDAKRAFTKYEANYLAGRTTDQNTKTQLRWRAVAACTLLWALGEVPELVAPNNHSCNGRRLVEAFARLVPKVEHRGPYSLRPMDTILDAADLYYRYHWATEDARIKGQSPPEALNSSIVLERRWALDWLILGMNRGWEDIRLDT